jgi:hypothetical protein
MRTAPRPSIIICLPPGASRARPGTQDIAVLGFLDADAAEFVQTLGKGFGERCRHVLHEHNRRREIARQLRQYTLQGHRPTGRGANGHQFVRPCAWARQNAATGPAALRLAIGVVRAVPGARRAR